jgi:hypothetical protein
MTPALAVLNLPYELLEDQNHVEPWTNYVPAQFSNFDPVGGPVASSCALFLFPHRLHSINNWEIEGNRLIVPKPRHHSALLRPFFQPSSSRVLASSV